MFKETEGHLRIKGDFFMYTYIEIRAEYEIENLCVKSNKLMNFKHKEVMMSLMDQLNRAIKEAIKIKQQKFWAS